MNYLSVVPEDAGSLKMSCSLLFICLSPVMNASFLPQPQAGTVIVPLLAAPKVLALTTERQGRSLPLWISLVLCAQQKFDRRLLPKSHFLPEPCEKRVPELGAVQVKW